MKKIIVFLCIVSFAAAVPVLLLSCGSGGGGIGGGISDEDSFPGSVALYVTDSLNDYKQVRITINDIQLEHIGTGAACDVLENPVTIDITDLSSVLQLLDVKTCPAIGYNRIIIELDQQTVLTDSNNVSAECNLATYKDNHGGTNTLQCGDTCSINMSGAVNVSSNKTNKLALDFDLKDFDVINFGGPFCSLTMKVFPLNASDFDQKHEDGWNERVSGSLSELDTVEKSFILTAESGSFTVTYTDVTAPGIDDLLSRAAADPLKVKVESSSINLNTRTIAATALYVEVEGTVSGLNTVDRTFTLTYQADKQMLVAYQTDGVEGNLLSDSVVELKLNGYDGEMYVATEVEVK